MIVTFPTPSGGQVGVNPTQVLALEPVGHQQENTRIILGHSVSYIVGVPIDKAAAKLDM